MSESKVVALNGRPLPEPGKVNETLVGFLEDALEKARSGEITGIAGSWKHSDNSGSFFVVGTIGGHSMLGAMQIAHARLTKIVAGDFLT